MHHNKVNDSVTWKWANGVAKEVVKSISPKRTEVTIDGKKNVRNGTAENPALTIKHESGQLVLKLQNEINTTQ